MELIQKIGSSAEGGPKIWTVSSGKGGVGKTFISTSLAFTLSKLGHSVVIADLDFSGANVHTALGLKPSHLNIRHYIEGSKTLNELVIPTPFPHLSYIQGYWDTWAPADISSLNTQALMHDLKKIKADYVIIDTGYGVLDKYLEIFKFSDEKILVTSTEPTSIEKTYRFIENFICYSLKDKSTPESFAKLIKTLRDYRQKILNKPFSFRSYLKESDGFTLEPFLALSRQPIRLVLNSVRSQSLVELGFSMKSVCYKYYDLRIDYIGGLDYDNAVWQSIKNREPVLIAQPFTPLAGQFLAMCKHLIDPEELRAVV
ncbi:MAG: P-loop NTPase [Bdellovibrionota bacterium]